MPKNAYFARYPSLNNIIIVPTVSFCPPPPHTSTEHIVDPNASSPTSPRLNWEQLTPAKDYTGELSALPCRSNYDSQNLQVTSSITSTSTEFSDTQRNSPCVIIEDTTSTEAVFNMSPSIKDLSRPKYKSSNNLVDLTGFNLLKRERDSTSLLPKRKDLSQIDYMKIKHDKMKTNYAENENRDYSDSDSYKTDNISKESSTSEKPNSTHSEKNTENLANGEPKENKTDMDGKMKKYFRQLWKRNFEKLKDRAAKEKNGIAIKSSSKIRQDYKDSKEESNHSKAKLQKVPKTNSTKELRNKIMDSSKKYRDLECHESSMVKYKKNISKRSKSETNSCHSPNSKVSIRDRKIDLSPDSIKKYKDFQRFTRKNDDPEIKYKSGNQTKTENHVPRKKIRKKSCETSKKKTVIKKKVDEHKQTIKAEKRSKVNTNQTNLERIEIYTDKERAIDQSNTERDKLIKNVERVDKNVHNNLSQCTPSEVQDLRSKLSRKRAKSGYFVSYREPMKNTLDQESLMITVKQDVKADSKNSPKLAPTEKKPKHKKCKKIKIIINIECPNSDSDNSDQDFNECCSSPEDLSFLDDFNIEEIVDSLNNSQVEPNKTITKDNDYKNNKQIKPNEVLINNANIKAINIKKEETSSHKGQVIEIDSDTEDMNFEIGSVANTKKCKDEQNMEENTKVDRNTKQEANNITDLTGNGYDENATKETINLSDCSDSVVEVIAITDENEHYMTSKHLQQKKTIQNCKLQSKLANNVNLAKFQLLNKSNKASVNRRTGLENANKKKHNTQHEENTPRITVKQKSDPSNITKKKQLQKSEDPIEASLQAMFNNEQDKSVNSFGVKSDVIKQLNTLDKHVKENNDNSEDTVEALLETMFNKYEQNSNIRKHIEQNKINGCDKKTKENSIQKSVVEVSLESTFYGTKHQDTGINMDIEQPSSSGQHIRKEKDVLQTAQVMIKIPLKTMNNIVAQKKNLNDIKIKLSNISDNKHIKIESESQKPENQILPETTKNGIEQNAEIKINSKPAAKRCSLKFGSISKVSLETEENILEKANSTMDTPLCSKNFKKHLQAFKDSVKKPKDKLINKIEKKTKKSSPPSKKDSGNSTKGTFETAKSFGENCLTSPQFDIRPQNNLVQKNKPKGEPLQKSVETIKTSSKAMIDNGEQKTNIRSESNKSDKNIEERKKEREERRENSKLNSKNSPERSNIKHDTNVTTGVELKMPDKNIEVTSRKTSISKAEKSLTANNKESTLTSKTSNNLTTSVELIIPDKNIEVTSQKTSISKAEKSLTANNKESTTSSNVTTSAELIIPDKNIEVTSQKTSISKTEKSLTANNKESTLISKNSNVENQTKSETVKNNTEKLETIVDASSDLSKISKKDSELGKSSETATNTKTKQEQEVSHKSLVPDGSNNNIYRKNAELFTRMKPFLSKLESRMSEYLQQKYTISSIIHNGRFSTIYKCFDTKGETYAVKVVNQQQTGMFMEVLLFLLQQSRSRRDSFVLYLMNAFEVQNQWCLLTEFYPKNLKEALQGYTYGFHIDEVQILSRQLVDAVNMLKNAGVTHSDIKPTHILLNNAHNRLKLCGFDRSNYSSCLNITPITGTSSYRAPEVILGFQENHRIDVWSTALVMFEMATNKTLISAGPNNDILYQQLCTFGSLDWTMLEQSRYRTLHFFGTSFLRKYSYKNIEKTIVLSSLQRNENLRTILFQSYEQQCTRVRSKWQMTKDIDKLESLHTLLEQMLVLNPRNRLPIQFVGASEFMNPHQFRIA